MPSSPDNAPALANPQPLGPAYHQRNRSRGVENLQVRGRNISRYEFGRRDRYGERVTRIYPREIAKSPTTNNLYPSSPGAAPATSPLLKALGSTTTTAAQYTSEWTKSLPFFAGQQPASNPRSISGSPPVYMPPNGRDIGHVGISNSPPTIGGRPLSHPNPYPSFGGRLQGSPHQSPPRDRRASMFSQYSQQPPLPHQPQSHFYGLPDMDFGLDQAASDLTPGSNGYLLGFDTLGSSGDSPSAGAGQNVLVVGYEGGLDVLDVGRRHMNVLGRLEGLKGAVIGAKILPWTAREDLCQKDRPLIALIMHGPVIEDLKDLKDARNASGSSSDAETDENGSTSNPPTRPASIAGGEPFSDITHYQTTVEVWSLKNGSHVATLYRTPPTPVSQPCNSPLFQAPPPIGDLRIDANGKFVVVASGSSGEIHIFSPKRDGQHPESFRCIGKVWTTVQIREQAACSSTSSSAEAVSIEGEPPVQYRIPLFSLSHRWIAVVPPGSSSLYSLNGAPLLSPVYPRPPGISTHASPPPPPVTCQVDAPDDGFFRHASREMAQHAMKGMQWAAKNGMSAWKSYWNKPSAGPDSANGTISPDGHGQGYFPPTHGINQTSSQSNNEPALVSIIDLQKLAEAEASRNRNCLHPLATFTAPLGCSFLSFSPSGLMLMTFSRKGDSQFVWDLMCMHHGRSSNSSSNKSSPQSHVRQVAKFTRVTPANIVDVAWSSPKGRRLAILTDKGTVHMYPMPAAAFQWPPPRRRLPVKPKPSTDEPANSNTGGSAAQNITGKALPFLNAVRSRTRSVGHGLPNLSSLSMTPAVGAKSSKAVAAGLGKSIGGAASTLRHARDNKLQLPNLSLGVNSGSVRWLVSGKRRKGSRIALVAGGILSIYHVNFMTVRGKNGVSQARISAQRLVDFNIPPIRDAPVAPAVLAYLNAKPGEEVRHPSSAEKDQGSYWVPRAPPGSRKTRVGRGVTGHPLSNAEIETNPPYQPFHTDKRIGLFVYTTDNIQQDSETHTASQIGLLQSQHVDDDTPWVFGEPIPSAKIALPSAHVFQYDGEGEDELMGLDGAEGEGRNGVESSLVLKEGEEEVEQVVVTTRRRKIKRSSNEGVIGEEEGFFEDDCDVLDFAGDRV